MTIGQLLRQYRTQRSLSQAEVADACLGTRGITQSIVSKWERDVGEPSASQLAALCDALNLSDQARLNLLRGRPVDHAAQAAA